MRRRKIVKHLNTDFCHYTIKASGNTFDERFYDDLDYRRNEKRKWMWYNYSSGTCMFIDYLSMFVGQRPTKVNFLIKKIIINKKFAHIIK
jgi:hypothetical protein